MFAAKRHQKWHSLYGILNLEDLSEKLRTVRIKADVDALHLQLNDSQSATVKLQKYSTSLLNARIPFSKILVNFPERSDSLSTSRKIIENSAFEIVLAKFQTRTKPSLSAREKRSVKFLKNFDTAEEAASTSDYLTLADNS